MPPYITAPPEPTVVASDESALAENLSTGFYADILDAGNAAQFHPQLKEAVNQAIRLGILKPVGFQERFNPERSITYGEFRSWIVEYQRVIAEDEMQTSLQPGGTDKKGATNMPTVSAASASSSVPPVVDRLDSPMNPAKLFIPPSTFAWAGHQLVENTTMTREELCAIYTFLSHQDEKAGQLTGEAIERMAPSGAASNAEDTLGQFKDYNNISEWARRYVAIAYQNQLLKNLFQLTPNRLIIDEGFLPQHTVNRGEALVLLQQLYGPKLALVMPKPLSNEGMASQSERNAASSLSNQALTTPGKGASLVVPKSQSSGKRPVQMLQSIQESGPEGTRSSLRINGPE